MLILATTFSILLVLVSIFSFWQVYDARALTSTVSSNIVQWSNSQENINSESDNNTSEKKYIKWFEFKVTYEVLDKTSKLDINSHNKNENVKLNWIQLISYLACKYGNDFSRFKQKDLDSLVEKLRNGQTIEDLTKDMKNYNYYFEGYDAVLHEFIGDYKAEVKSSTTNKLQNTQTANVEITSNAVNLENAITEQQVPIEKQFEEKYGIKAFHPVAKNYSYSHYDDFGASRSYGYKRVHFGNDLMGSIGAPIIAVESGIIEAVRLESVWRLENWNS